MSNQYSIPKGRIRLRQALSEQYSEGFRLPGGRKLNPDTEIVITSGANMAIYSTLLAYAGPGDEVIVFEPFFDQYSSNVEFCGATPVFVPIRPPADSSSRNVKASEWRIDLAEFEAAITSKTRIVILNTPHNPIGKVFTADELRELGRIAAEKNLLIISDEVYDILTYGTEHVRIASLSEDLWNRTLTVGSAGKSFSATGWRLGWVFGPAHLIGPATVASTRTVFSSNSPLQEAVATGLEKEREKNFFANQQKEYAERLKVMTSALDKLGLPYTIPDGAYYILVDNSRIEIPENLEIIDQIRGRPRDWLVSWFLAKEIGVVVSGGDHIRADSR